MHSVGLNLFTFIKNAFAKRKRKSYLEKEGSFFSESIYILHVA